jgi:pyrroline-5-carboxylate reductase
MPNTPALVGSGMTAFARGKNATARDVKVVRRLFGAVGEVIEVRENDLDAVTAVSGSGPAYFSYFLESFLSGARKLGLGKKLTKILVMKTAIGTLELLAQTGMSPEKLMKQVTSKGGTTEAAIRHLEGKQFRPIIEQAVKKAWLRSGQLRRLGELTRQ